MARGLLFDDVLWAQKAREEHDVFAEILREHGVRVHYFGQLLAETLELPEGPKVEAACRFVEATSRMAAIGRLDTAEALLHRTADTIISP